MLSLFITFICPEGQKHNYYVTIAIQGLCAHNI